MSDTLIQLIAIAWFVYIAVAMYLVGRRIKHKRKNLERKKLELAPKP